jgi:hypothetical protein
LIFSAWNCFAANIQQTNLPSVRDKLGEFVQTSVH